MESMVQEAHFITDSEKEQELGGIDKGRYD